MSQVSHQRTIQYIPLSLLSLSPENMRSGRAVESEFIRSIHENGVIQPLIVRGVGSTYEIAAGRRRYLALSKLLSKNKIARDYEVPCLVASDDDHMRTLSIVENLHRKTPHDAEYYRAIHELVKAGIDKRGICSTLQIDGAQYEKILRLATLHPKIFKAFSQDKLSGEQIRAFAATDNKKQQIEVWKQADYSLRISPALIRRQLVSEHHSHSPLCRFVGFDAYKKAGGGYTDDLFGNVQSLHDPDILIRLATEKLDTLIGEFNATHPDWKWTEYQLNDSLQDLQIIKRLQPRYHKHTDEQTARISALQDKLDAYDEMDDDDYTDDMAEEYERLEAQIEDIGDEIRNDNRYFLKKEMRHSGVVVTIGSRGETVYHMGLQKKDDVANQKKAATVKSQAADSPDSSQPQSDYSNALSRDVRLYKRSMLQVELLKRPMFAIELLHYSLITKAFTKYYTPTFNNISINSAEVDTSLGDYEASDMALLMNRSHEQLDLSWMNHDTEKAKVEGYLGLSTSMKTQLLAYIAAWSMESDLDRFIEETTGITYRDYFTPGFENYFSRIPRPMLEAHHGDITGAAPSEADLKTTKKELAVRLAGHFAGKSANKTWMPPLFASTCV